MRRGSGSDNLAHSFTDLMTSLMVIFILLLLIFLNNQASVNTSVTQSLLADMRQQLSSPALQDDNISVSKREPFTIVLSIPNDLMTFEPNKHQLRPEGERFVREQMPKLARLLCQDKYRSSVQSVIVEGHSDGSRYRGVTSEQSERLNLKLSQDRSMEVAGITLAALSGEAGARGCLLEKLSVSGRGEQDRETTPEDSRRVVVKVRVNPRQGTDMLASSGLRRDVELGTMPESASSPAVSKVLDLFEQLRAVPPQPVSFRLTEDEINEYLKYALYATPRPGIQAISVKIFPRNYISTHTIVDFDAVERWKPGTIPLFLRPVLNGRKAIWLDYRFQSEDGKATFSIEKAYYQNVSLPRFFVRSLMEAVAARQPEQYDLSRPVPLPFGLREVSTDAGVLTGRN